MTVTINASSTNGLVQTADGSGVLKVQSNGVTTNALAWVNFNGTGTVAIRSSYNVSSITDNGTGNYTVNFATALSDANYSVLSSANRNTGSQDNASISYGLWTSSFSYTTTSVAVAYVASNSINNDAAIFNVAVFGN